MKTSDWLILGGITAAIFAFGKKASMAGIGAVTRGKSIEWLLKNRHKLNGKFKAFELVVYYENFKIGGAKAISKSFNDIVSAVSFWEQAAFNLPRNGYTVTLATLHCYINENKAPEYEDEAIPLKKTL